MPDVDVVIPAYNAESTISATLDSILQQSEPAERIIVVDDGSTDGTAQVAAKYGPAVQVITKENGGQGSARQAGAAHCRSEFLLFIDADDRLVPQALERLRVQLQAHRQCVLAYCRAQVVQRPGAAVAVEASRLPDDVEGDALAALMEANFIRTPGCALIRRSAFEAAGGWDTRRELCGHEDWDLWIRLARLGCFARIADELLLYQVHGQSFSANAGRMMLSSYSVVAKHWPRGALSPEQRQKQVEISKRMAQHLVRRLATGVGPGYVWRCCGTMWRCDRLFPLRMVSGSVSLAWGATRRGRAGHWVTHLLRAPFGNSP